MAATRSPTRCPNPEVYAYEHRSLGGIVRDTMESLLAHGWLDGGERRVLHCLST